MANQPPRPAWFRLSSLAGRAPPPAPTPARPPVPAPAPAPLRPPAPVPAAVRPSIPTRPVAPPPTQTQEDPALPPPPSQSQVAPPPPPPPRSPVSPTPSPRPSPPAAPQPSPPKTPASIRSSPPPAAAQPSPPMAPASARSSPPSSPAYAAAPPPAALAAKYPLQNSPVQKVTSAAATDVPAATSPPKTKNTGTPSSIMPTSPKQKPAETANAKASTPVPSPKVVKPFERTPAQSPNLKCDASQPPSPFTLPPAQVNHGGEPDNKIDQKNVLVQQSIDKPVNKHMAHNNLIPSNGKREPTSRNSGLISKKVYDSEKGMGMRMITLAGENKGAVMELNHSQKKNYSAGNPRSLQKQQGIKSGCTNRDQSSSASENDEGKSSSNKDKMSRSMTMQSPMKANLNSNVQGLNNSILLNCSFRNNDPGIHLKLTRKANGAHTIAMDK